MARGPRRHCVRQRIEEHVFREAAGGCPAAFERIYTALVGAVRHTAYKVIGDEHEAEDVAQEVFLVALDAIRRMENPCAFPKWVHRVAFNAAIDRVRRVGRCRPQSRVHDEQYDAADSLSRVVRRSGGGEPSPVSLACLRSEYDDLPPQVQETFSLHYREGRSCRSIAREQGVSLSCVKTRLHRARERLLDAFDAEAR